MKYLVWFVLVMTLFLFSCTSSNGISSNSILHDFMKDITVLESLDTTDSAILFMLDEAHKTAYKSKVFTKETIEEILEDANNYSALVIIVENHTIVKINDFKNCTQSNAWGACMPYGEGYIRKGTLVKQQDYVNNIIGLPDKQLRTAFFYK